MGDVKKRNTRWTRFGVRYSSERTLEDTRFVREANGRVTKKTDTPTEAKWVERRREEFGWRNGAKVTLSRRSLPADARL